MRKTKVLTNWQPTKLKVDTIHREFTGLLRELGWTTELGIDIREPSYFGKIDVFALGWHTDPDRTTKDQIMPITICWSNVNPTEVRFDDDQSLLVVKPGDVVLIDNAEVHHCAPRRLGKKRWFVRAWRCEPIGEVNNERG